MDCSMSGSSFDRQTSAGDDEEVDPGVFDFSAFDWYMGDTMSKVLPGLYVGSWKDARDVNQIKEQGITHILFIEQFSKEGKMPGVQYLCIHAQDHPGEILSKHFPVCNDFIHGARVSGGNVLVHCIAGVSRSVTVTMAYLMTILPEMDAKNALRCVRGARSRADPNSGFIKQLQAFEGRRVREERQRLSAKFNYQLALPGDEEESKRQIAEWAKGLLPYAKANQMAEKIAQQNSSKRPDV